MTYTPSFLIRVARAVTALATVWSLGCCGFEPLLGQLFAADTSTMSDCAAGAAAAQSAGETGALTRPSNANAALTADGSELPPAVVQPHQDTACGCATCVAPVPPLTDAPLGAPPAPTAVASALTRPVDVVRAPLVPPPQRA